MREREKARYTRSKREKEERDREKDRLSAEFYSGPRGRSALTPAHAENNGRRMRLLFHF